MAGRSGVEAPWGGWWHHLQARGRCVVVRRGGNEARGRNRDRGTRIACRAFRCGRASNGWRSPMSPRGCVDAAGARGRWLVLSGEISVGFLGCPTAVVAFAGWDGTRGGRKVAARGGEVAEAVVPTGVVVVAEREDKREGVRARGRRIDRSQPPWAPRREGQIRVRSPTTDARRERSDGPAPGGTAPPGLWERVFSRENLARALRRVVTSHSVV
jgi:hypothetical protein